MWMNGLEAMSLISYWYQSYRPVFTLPVLSQVLVMYYYVLVKIFVILLNIDSILHTGRNVHFGAKSFVGNSRPKMFTIRRFPFVMRHYVIFLSLSLLHKVTSFTRHLSLAMRRVSYKISSLSCVSPRKVVSPITKE